MSAATTVWQEPAPYVAMLCEHRWGSRCQLCFGAGTADGGAQRRCGRCRVARYCSRKCQQVGVCNMPLRVVKPRAAEIHPLTYIYITLVPITSLAQHMRFRS